MVIPFGFFECYIVSPTYNVHVPTLYMVFTSAIEIALFAHVSVYLWNVTCLTDFLVFLLQDLTNLYEQYRSIEPWLQRTDENVSDENRTEYYQSVDDRKKLVRLICS